MFRVPLPVFVICSTCLLVCLVLGTIQQVASTNNYQQQTHQQLPATEMVKFKARHNLDRRQDREDYSTVNDADDDVNDDASSSSSMAASSNVLQLRHQPDAYNYAQMTAASHVSAAPSIRNVDEATSLQSVQVINANRSPKSVDVDETSHEMEEQIDSKNGRSESIEIYHHEATSTSSPSIIIDRHDSTYRIQQQQTNRPMNKNNNNDRSATNSSGTWSTSTNGGYTLSNLPPIDELDSQIITNRSTGEMILKLNFSEPFRGITYPDYNRLSPCRLYGDGSRYYELRLPLKGCGTRQAAPRVFVNNVIVRFHRSLELEEDEIKTIICRYPPPLVAPLDSLTPKITNGDLYRQQQQQNQLGKLIDLPSTGNNGAPSLVTLSSRGNQGGGGGSMPWFLDRLSNVELLLLISSLLFFALLLFGTATSYLCLRRRRARRSAQAAAAVANAFGATHHKLRHNSHYDNADDNQAPIVWGASPNNPIGMTNDPLANSIVIPRANSGGHPLNHSTSYSTTYSKHHMLADNAQKHQYLSHNYEPGGSNSLLMASSNSNAMLDAIDAHTQGTYNNALANNKLSVWPNPVNMVYSLNKHALQSQGTSMYEPQHYLSHSSPWKLANTNEHRYLSSSSTMSDHQSMPTTMPKPVTLPLPTPQQLIDRAVQHRYRRSSRKLTKLERTRSTSSPVNRERGEHEWRDYVYDQPAITAGYDDGATDRLYAKSAKSLGGQRSRTTRAAGPAPPVPYHKQSKITVKNIEDSYITNYHTIDTEHYMLRDDTNKMSDRRDVVAQYDNENGHRDNDGSQTVASTSKQQQYASTSLSETTSDTTTTSEHDSAGLLIRDQSLSKRSHTTRQANKSSTTSKYPPKQAISTHDTTATDSSWASTPSSSSHHNANTATAKTTEAQGRPPDWQGTSADIRSLTEMHVDFARRRNHSKSNTHSADKKSDTPHQSANSSLAVINVVNQNELTATLRHDDSTDGHDVNTSDDESDFVISPDYNFNRIEFESTQSVSYV
ncbi:hypothetical protein GZH46_00706 [Fragariocoptes setiger]|uniref:Uncharacterized protein n=1 Tax=Fragariocoptes setiger TaxID=1670756 RepID=A0ABQ7SBD9_9ACAR|nr:hypothetical protein GZH46_00706 [Fragariocoptes setiger]